MQGAVKKQMSAVRDPERQTPGKIFLTVLFAVISLIWLVPIVVVLYNSFKTNASINLDVFALPGKESYVGFDNYLNGRTFGNYPF